MQYIVDKVEHVRETSLVLESGTEVPCDVLVNARKPPSELSRSDKSDCPEFLRPLIVCLMC